jgi:ketosteroid isomerase-like protein
VNAQERVRLHYTAVTTGDPDAAAVSVAPDFVNDEAAAEPPACALPGPAGVLATSAWLRFAFADLEIVEQTSLADADHVLSHITFRGTHTGPFTQFAEGRLTQVIPPTGRAFAVEQVHLFRLRDGELVGHAAVRDDLGLITGIGVFPPTPAVGLRIAWWRLTGRAATAGRAVVAASKEAAALVAPTGAR